MKLNKDTEAQKANMKDIFAGNDNNEGKKSTEKKAYSTSETTIKEEPLATGVEKDKTNENQKEDG